MTMRCERFKNEIASSATIAHSSRSHIFSFFLFPFSFFLPFTFFLLSFFVSAGESAPLQKDARTIIFFNAVNKSETAHRLANQMAEKLTLNAEVFRHLNDTPDRRMQADDLARLAAVINQEADEKLKPVANTLEHLYSENFQQDATLLKDLPAQTKIIADELNQLAGIAALLESGDIRSRKEGHDALAKWLAEKSLKKSLEDTLKTAGALNELASRIDKNKETENASAEKQPSAEQSNAKPDNQANKSEKNDPLAAAKELDSQRQELAKAMNVELSADMDRQALAAQMQELARELRNESEQNRQAAENLDRADSLEAQARNKLKKEGAELAKALREIGKEAGQLAQSASAQPLAAPLNNAEKSLPQTGQETEELAKQADSQSLSSLADKLDNLSQGLEKPIGEIAAALSQPNDKNAQQAAQSIGKKTRDVAGREADLANELRAADRANKLASARAETKNSDRAQLEQQARAAMEALERQSALPDAAQNDLASLRDSLEQSEKLRGEAMKNASQKSPSSASKASAAAAANQSNAQSNNSSSGNNQGMKNASQKSPSSASKASAAAAANQSNAQSNNSSSGNNQGGKGGSGSSSQKSQAQQARVEAERLAAMSNQMNRLAAALLENQHSKTTQLSQADKITPASLVNALGALTNAKASLNVGDAAQSEALRKQAAQMLDQAAEAMRDQAINQNNIGQGQGKNQGQKSDSPQALKDNIAQSSLKNLPIDATTWNRLPDNLRRDLLNAVGGRFPAEYEMSIRRYFKNIATSKNE